MKFCIVRQLIDEVCLVSVIVVAFSYSEKVCIPSGYFFVAIMYMLLKIIVFGKVRENILNCQISMRKSYVS